jgi:hypothetical protein
MAIEQLSNNSGDEKTDLSKEGIVDELNREDDEETKVPDEDDREEDDADKEDEDDKEDDEEESKEDDEIKLVDEEDGEKEDDKEIDLVAPFRKAQIEKDFPGIFKKYPYLEKSYYTERAYREVFASPEDAKEAQESLEEVQELEQSLLQGDTTSLLGRVKEYDENAYARMVDNYLPSLQKVDPQAHNHVVGGIVKNLVALLVKEGKATDNDELRKVALAVNKFVFNSEEFEPYQKLAVDKKDTKAQDEQREFLTERFETVQDDLQGSVDNILMSTIKANIDPKGVFSDYVKKNATRDAMEELKTAIDRDTVFRRHLDRLWEKAFASNFNRASVSAIKAAYLAKAKTTLKPVISKARGEALKGMGKRVREDDGDSDTQQAERKFAKSKRGSSPSDKGGHKKSDIPRGMSTLDFLNKD